MIFLFPLLSQHRLLSLMPSGCIARLEATVCNLQIAGHRRRGAILFGHATMPVSGAWAAMQEQVLHLGQAAAQAGVPGIQGQRAELGAHYYPCRAPQLRGATQ